MKWLATLAYTELRCLDTLDEAVDEESGVFSKSLGEDSLFCFFELEQGRIVVA